MVNQKARKAIDIVHVILNKSLIFVYSKFTAESLA